MQKENKNRLAKILLGIFSLFLSFEIHLIGFFLFENYFNIFQSSPQNIELKNASSPLLSSSMPATGLNLISKLVSEGKLFVSGNKIYGINSGATDKIVKTLNKAAPNGVKYEQGKALKNLQNLETSKSVSGTNTVDVSGIKMPELNSSQVNAIVREDSAIKTLSQVENKIEHEKNVVDLVRQSDALYEGMTGTKPINTGHTTQEILGDAINNGGEVHVLDENLKRTGENLNFSQEAGEALRESYRKPGNFSTLNPVSPNDRYTPFGDRIGKVYMDELPESMQNKASSSFKVLTDKDSGRQYIEWDSFRHNGETPPGRVLEVVGSDGKSSLVMDPAYTQAYRDTWATVTDGYFTVGKIDKFWWENEASSKFLKDYDLVNPKSQFEINKEVMNSVLNNPVDGRGNKIDVGARINELLDPRHSDKVHPAMRDRLEQLKNDPEISKRLDDLSKEIKSNSPTQPTVTSPAPVTSSSAAIAGLAGAEEYESINSNSENLTQQSGETGKNDTNTPANTSINEDFKPADMFSDAYTPSYEQSPQATQNAVDPYNGSEYLREMGEINESLKTGPTVTSTLNHLAGTPEAALETGLQAGATFAFPGSGLLSNAAGLVTGEAISAAFKQMVGKTEESPEVKAQKATEALDFYENTGQWGTWYDNYIKSNWDKDAEAEWVAQKVAEKYEPERLALEQGQKEQRKMLGLSADGDAEFNRAILEDQKNQRLELAAEESEKNSQTFSATDQHSGAYTPNQERLENQQTDTASNSDQRSWWEKITGKTVEQKNNELAAEEKERLGKIASAEAGVSNDLVSSAPERSPFEKGGNPQGIIKDFEKNLDPNSEGKKFIVDPKTGQIVDEKTGKEYKGLNNGATANNGTDEISSDMGEIVSIKGKDSSSPDDFNEEEENNFFGLPTTTDIPTPNELKDGTPLTQIKDFQTNPEAIQDNWSSISNSQLNSNQSSNNSSLQVGDPPEETTGNTMKNEPAQAPGYPEGFTCRGGKCNPGGDNIVDPPINSEVYSYDYLPELPTENGREGLLNNLLFNPDAPVPATASPQAINIPSDLPSDTPVLYPGYRPTVAIVEGPDQKFQQQQFNELTGLGRVIPFGGTGKEGDNVTVVDPGITKVGPYGDSSSHISPLRASEASPMERSLIFDQVVGSGILQKKIEENNSLIENLSNQKNDLAKKINEINTTPAKNQEGELEKLNWQKEMINLQQGRLEDENNNMNNLISNAAKLKSNLEAIRGLDESTGSLEEKKRLESENQGLIQNIDQKNTVYHTEIKTLNREKEVSLVKERYDSLNEQLAADNIDPEERERITSEKENLGEYLSNSYFDKLDDNNKKIGQSQKYKDFYEKSLKEDTYPGLEEDLKKYIKFESEKIEEWEKQNSILLDKIGKLPLPKVDPVTEPAETEGSPSKRDAPVYTEEGTGFPGSGTTTVDADGIETTTDAGQTGKIKLSTSPPDDTFSQAEEEKFFGSPTTTDIPIPNELKGGNPFTQIKDIQTNPESIQKDWEKINEEIESVTNKPENPKFETMGIGETKTETPSEISGPNQNQQARSLSEEPSLNSKPEPKTDNESLQKSWEEINREMEEYQLDRDNPFNKIPGIEGDLESVTNTTIEDEKNKAIQDDWNEINKEIQQEERKESYQSDWDTLNREMEEYSATDTDSKDSPWPVAPAGSGAGTSGPTTQGDDWTDINEEIENSQSNNPLTKINNISADLGSVWENKPDAFNPNEWGDLVNRENSKGTLASPSSTGSETYQGPWNTPAGAGSKPAYVNENGDLVIPGGNKTLKNYGSGIFGKDALISKGLDGDVIIPKGSFTEDGNFYEVNKGNLLIPIGKGAENAMVAKGGLDIPPQKEPYEYTEDDWKYFETSSPNIHSKEEAEKINKKTQEDPGEGDLPDATPRNDNINANDNSSNKNANDNSSEEEKDNKEKDNDNTT